MEITQNPTINNSRTEISLNMVLVNFIRPSKRTKITIITQEEVNVL